MNKKSSNNDNTKKKKASIFKEDLEFEVFHLQVTNKFKEDKKRAKNLYRDELLFELSKIKNNENRIEFLEEKYQQNQIEYDLIVGMCKENILEVLDLKIDVIVFLMKNVKGIPYEISKIKKNCFHLPGTKKYNDFVECTFNYMIDNKFISQKTTKSAFRSIFNREVRNKKVNWEADISQLYYFILLLIKLPEIKFKNQWITTCDCFLLEGESITNERFHGQKKPKTLQKTEAVGIIFKNF
jgi:hypothetical protein